MEHPVRKTIRLKHYDYSQNGAYFVSICTHNRMCSLASLQQMIGAYKSCVSTAYLKICKANNVFMGEIWQRSYHEHIIRNENSYQEIWQYIDTNPIKWELDYYHTK